MKAVLFDLDDTLYPEIDFVKSGFRTVACYLSSRYALDEETLFTRMLDIMQRDGRGKIFDSLLQDNGLYTEERVRLLVYLYRSHYPDIQLHQDVRPTLKQLRDHKIHLGIVTDGMASVQRKKIAALDLERLFDVIVCSDELSKECWKPSTIPYTVALELLQVLPPEAAYVGDDPSKDFLGPKSLGMLTIQIKREKQRQLTPHVIDKLDNARYTVKELGKILPIIVGKM